LIVIVSNSSLYTMTVLYLLLRAGLTAGKSATAHAHWKSHILMLLNMSMNQAKKKELVVCALTDLDFDLSDAVATGLATELGHQPPATLDDVLLVDGIVDLFALSATAYQTHVFEDAQVMGDGRLRQVKRVDDVTDAPLALEQQAQDSLARFVGQRSTKGYTINDNGWCHNFVSGLIYR
jgi:hypothetical protein